MPFFPLKEWNFTLNIYDVSIFWFFFANLQARRRDISYPNPSFFPFLTLSNLILSPPDILSNKPNILTPSSLVPRTPLVGAGSDNLMAKTKGLEGAFVKLASKKMKVKSTLSYDMLDFKSYI